MTNCELYRWHDPVRGFRTLAIHTRGRKWTHGWVLDCPYVRNVRLRADLRYPSSRRPGQWAEHRLTALDNYPIERYLQHMRRLRDTGWTLPAKLEKLLEVDDEHHASR